MGARLKMTEQGEVLAAKYAVDEIAHRELELTTSAVLVSSQGGGAVGISDEVRDELVDLGIGKPSQYRVIPLGFDLAPFLDVDGQRIFFCSTGCRDSYAAQHATH